MFACIGVATAQKIGKLEIVFALKLRCLEVHAGLVNNLVLETDPHVSRARLILAGKFVLGLASNLLLASQL